MIDLFSSTTMIFSKFSENFSIIVSSNGQGIAILRNLIPIWLATSSFIPIFSSPNFVSKKDFPVLIIPTFGFSESKIILFKLFILQNSFTYFILWWCSRYSFSCAVSFSLMFNPSDGYFLLEISKRFNLFSSKSTVAPELTLS